MQAVYVDPGAPGKNPPTITALDCGVCGNRDMTRAMSDSAITFAIVGAVVIPPRSGMIGRPVFPGMVTESGELVILAVQRRGGDMGPGGYTFSDYVKFGLPIMIWYFLVAVFYVPLFWRF